MFCSEVVKNLKTGLKIIIEIPIGKMESSQEFGSELKI